MARRYGEPIPVIACDGQPIAFTWRDVTYRVQTIGAWRLSTRWWEVESGAAVDRRYFRVQAPDHQIFEIYCEPGELGERGDGAHAERWVLDVCLD